MSLNTEKDVTSKNLNEKLTCRNERIINENTRKSPSYYFWYNWIFNPISSANSRNLDIGTTHGRTCNSYNGCIGFQSSYQHH